MSVAERIFDATARIETMIYIPAIGDADSASEQFGDFVRDLPERKDCELYKSLPELREFADGEYPEAWEVAELLFSRSGFIFNAATPVMEPVADGISSYSWGYYHTEWLYAKDQDAIADVLVAWATAFHERDKAKKQEA